jgi:FixJ family two-component response regulator
MRAESAPRVLHIDDDRSVGREVRDLLALRKIDCQCGTDLNEARSILERDPDRRVVLVDFHLPGMSGAEIIEILQRDFDRNLAFIVLTGDETQETAVESLRANAFDFLRKPVDARKLVQTIQRASDQLHEASSDPKTDEASRNLELSARLSEQLSRSKVALTRCVTEAEWLRPGDRGEAERALDNLLGCLMQVHLALEESANAESAEALESTIAQARQFLDAMRAVLGNDELDGSVVRMRPFDLTDLLGRISPSVEQVAAQQGIRFRMLTPKGQTYVLGDEATLGRAFVEIILAFIARMNTGEELLLAPVREGQGLTLVLKTDHPSLRTSLPDALLKEMAPTLNQQGQLDPEAVKLTACRLLVGLHGGRISEDTALGGQPRLRLYLPLAMARDDGTAVQARAWAR